MLRVENVCYRYNRKGVDVLHDVSYTFGEGLVYAIMGHSGSGKTTLLSLLAKLDSPTAGKIYFNERDIAALDTNKYRANCISIIFQSYNLLNKYTALDNIIMALNINKFAGNKAQYASTLLQGVFLDDEKHGRVVANLSGGEQQRVAIARAIASNASVILADEPTGNLDSVNTKQVIDTLFALKQSHKKCVIIVTHDERIANQADVIITIREGRLV